MINLDNSNVNRTLIHELVITDRPPPQITGVLALCLRFTLCPVHIRRTKESSLSLKISQFSLQNRGKIAIFIKVDFVFQVSNSKLKNARLHTSGVSSKIAAVAAAKHRHLSFLRAV